MALFASHKLTVEEVERELNRPLAGDPSGGELSVVIALNGLRLEDVRARLDSDSSLGRDFRELIDQKLRSAGGEIKGWTVHLPAHVWEEYSRLARIANISVSQSLAAAIQRDVVRRRSVADTAAVLEESVRAYHRAASRILDELNAVVQRLGAIQDLTNRITRIEKALASSRPS